MYKTLARSFKKPLANRRQPHRIERWAAIAAAIFDIICNTCEDVYDFVTWRYPPLQDVHCPA